MILKCLLMTWSLSLSYEEVASDNSLTKITEILVNSDQKIEDFFDQVENIQSSLGLEGQVNESWTTILARCQLTLVPKDSKKKVSIPKCLGGTLREKITHLSTSNFLNSRVSDLTYFKDAKLKNHHFKQLNSIFDEALNQSLWYKYSQKVESSSTNTKKIQNFKHFPFLRGNTEDKKSQKNVEIKIGEIISIKREELSVDADSNNNLTQDKEMLICQSNIMKFNLIKKVKRKPPLFIKSKNEAFSLFKSGGG